MIFVGIITSLFYNFYITTNSKNRNAIATNYIIDIVEEIKLIDYEDIDQQSVEEVISNMEIPASYTIVGQLQRYNETEGNTDKADLIKILKITAEYSLGEKTEKIEISTLITK